MWGRTWANQTPHSSQSSVPAMCQCRLLPLRQQDEQTKIHNSLSAEYRATDNDKALPLGWTRHDQNGLCHALLLPLTNREIE